VHSNPAAIVQRYFFDSASIKKQLCNYHASIAHQFRRNSVAIAQRFDTYCAIDVQRFRRVHNHCAATSEQLRIDFKAIVQQL
jgi:hypothetical protein